jgi:asparagine synthase (glutamine-hydrolysing)
MRSLLSEGFKIALSSVAALGLDKSWLGRIITEKDVDKLVELNRKYHINVAGEGGEYESLVLHCPLFKRELKITESEIIEEKSHTAKLIVKKAALN